MKKLLTTLLVTLTTVGISAQVATAAGLFDVGPCDSYCDEPSCGVDTMDTAGCGLLGCVQPSERCFDDFISPMINFVFFEDPRTLSEIRPIFVHHNLPDRVGDLNLPGGAVQLYALQFRVALTERLSLIAVKDGYVVADMDPGPLDNLLDDGWAAVTAGLKYNVLRDTQRGRLASLGFTYELPIGSQQTLQDVGDGEFHLFATAGQRLLDGDAHFLTSLGYRFPVDREAQTASMHWSNHLDYRLTDKLYVFTEMAWWHWTESASGGGALPLGVAGQDLFNLSSSNVEGNDLVTQNVGLKLKPKRNTEIGLAYEFPISDFEDIIDDRIQVDLIFRY